MALRDASFKEMEKSEEMLLRAKQSQRDAERRRLADEAHDWVPRRDSGLDPATA